MLLVLRIQTAFLWIPVIAWACLHTAEADHAGDIQKLKDELLLGYDKDVVPQSNASVPVLVDCTFNLSSVLDFDELAMEFSVVGLILLIWNDPRLAWVNDRVNGTNNLETILLPLDTVWTPPLILVNPAEKVTTLAQSYMTVRYLKDGTAFWFAGDVFKTVCTVDVTYFPFDKQRCEIYFFPLNLMPSEVQLTSRFDKANLASNFVEHGKWEVADSEVFADDIDGSFSMFAISIDLKRRPIFFVVNVFLPVLFMSILNTIVFALPAESGERMSYCITVLLAIAVFLTILGDNIPKTSSPMSLLSFFLLGQLSVSVFICFSVVLNLRLFHKSDGQRIPTALTVITRVLNCKVKKEDRRNLQNKYIQNNDFETTYDDSGCQQDNIGNIRDASHPSNNNFRVPRIILPLDTHARNHVSVYEHNQSQRCHQIQNGRHDRHDELDSNIRATKGSEEGANREDDPLTWQDVSRAVDKVLAVMCFIVIIASVIGFFLGVSNQGENSVTS